VQLFFKDVTERQIRAFENRCHQVHSQPASAARAAAARATAPSPAAVQLATQQQQQQQQQLQQQQQAASPLITLPPMRGLGGATARTEASSAELTPPLSAAQDSASLAQALHARYRAIGVQYSTAELDKLKTLFAQFARAKVDTASASASASASPSTVASEDVGQHQLWLDFDGFLGLASTAAERDAVFGRFRDRYALRAAAQNPALARRLFLACFSPYASGSLGAASTSTSTSTTTSASTTSPSAPFTPAPAWLPHTKLWHLPSSVEASSAGAALAADAVATDAAQASPFTRTAAAASAFSPYPMPPSPAAPQTYQKVSEEREREGTRFLVQALKRMIYLCGVLCC
jgi:hypothetical protein